MASRISAVRFNAVAEERAVQLCSRCQREGMRDGNLQKVEMPVAGNCP